MDDLIGARIHITGVVQGVGFRPFVYGLAQRLSLVGWVRNTSAGVDIEIDSRPETLDEFTQALQTQAPPLAHIDSFQIERCAPNGYNTFEIIKSQALLDAFQPVSPDVSICDDCLSELFDPKDRRYLYPFINCTNCGPRFTIIQDIPYDRPNTTMGLFPMCPQCAAEYHNPLNRRFHAQPVACAVCGPHIWLETPESGNLEDIHPGGTPASQHPSSKDVIRETQCLLTNGKVVAIKGLGGFHLACDALNAEAVSKLRRRKLRVDKPFALMMPDLETIGTHCYLSDEECELLTSRERPIVILRRKETSTIAREVAPGQNTLGVMLPYTPLHYLLVSPIEDDSSRINISRILVMTSGNLSEEPIANSNQDARHHLAELADAFLMHNRPIHTRCDDSVIRVFHRPTSGISEKQINLASIDNTYPLRRSRGYAPYPVRLPWRNPSILAAGAELKNAFCLTRDEYAFMSHHIGDLQNYETLCAFEEGIQHYERLFRIQPEALAYDLHPDYLATRYILERATRQELPAIGVQHHHAHIVACMAEHSFPQGEQGIGLAFDGIGFGEDGAIWGGEYLIVDYSTYQRPYHLQYVSLPGGDLATRQPWRMALSWLTAAGIPWSDALIPIQSLKQREPNATQQLIALKHQIESGINAPLTSSMGRLFDAVAALIGIRQLVNYEAQGAIELEALVDPDDDSHYSVQVPDAIPGDSRPIDPTPIFHGILKDLAVGISLSNIAARFHNSIAIMSIQACENLRSVSGLNQVFLSGGVWQNMTLLDKTVVNLKARNFKVYIHRRVPANDGGLALGQAIVASQKVLS